MNILNRYVARELLAVFLPALCGFVALYLIVDFFDRVDILLRHEATMRSAVKYFLFKVPLMVTQVLPAAVLLATIVGLGLLGRRNEITAMRAAGVSLWRTARPLLLGAAAISLAALIWDETVVPYASRQFQYVNNVEIRKRPERGIFSEREIWYRGLQGIYNIAHIDQGRGMLFGLTVYRLNDSFELAAVIEVPAATWRGAGWEVHHATEHWVGASGELQSRDLGPGEVMIGESLDDFREIHRRAEELTFLELRSRLQRLAAQGIDASEYAIDLQMKLAVPFATLVLAAVGVALAGRVRRHTSIAALVGMGLCAGAGYWMILALTRSLGEAEVISAIPAAWTANAVYLALAALLFLGREGGT